ncbi:nitroreductase family protein [Blautia sp.]|uniref:nitroreductase family protein n=1 Tax=Blautia sp. TaxID=1955243 RepID=UPI003AB86374
MEFQKLIETRRTIRKYAADSEVTREQMEALIRAAQEAPSWKNSETGRYYCVLSREMVDKIRATCLPGARNAEKSENAALIVTTFVHDRAGFQKDGTADNELGNGWGCYDLGLQNENLILKAADMGLSTLIMGLREADKLRELLDIPDTETIVAVIAVGKADESPNRPPRKELNEIARFF